MAQQFIVSKLNNVNHWNLLGVLLGLLAFLITDQRPQFVQVHRWAEFVVAVQMEIALTHFSKVTGMVFVKVDAVVVHATSVTATTGMFAVFSYTTMTMADVTAKLSCLLSLLAKLPRFLMRTRQKTLGTHS